jgi:hypothetical protein
MISAGPTGTASGSFTTLSSGTSIRTRIADMACAKKIARQAAGVPRLGGGLGRRRPPKPALPRAPRPRYAAAP